MTEYSVAKFSTCLCPVTEYSVGRVALFLTNATHNKTCGVSYHRNPRLPLWIGTNDIAVMLYGNYKPVLWKSDPLRFSGLPPHVEKNGWQRGHRCAVFHVYSLIKCLYVRLCLWRACHPYFLLLFSWSGKCNDVIQKSMFCESCPISVGNFKQFVLPENENILFQLCSACRQMNKVYKKYNFCKPNLNMTGATHFWLFSIEILKFPWQWWLHQHWAVLAVNKQVKIGQCSCMMDEVKCGLCSHVAWPALGEGWGGGMPVREGYSQAWLLCTVAWPALLLGNVVDVSVLSSHIWLSGQCLCWAAFLTWHNRLSCGLLTQLEAWFCVTVILSSVFKIFPSYCYQTLGRETSISLPIDSGNCCGLLKFWLYFKILFAFEKKRSRSICFIEFCCGNGFTPKRNSQRHSLCLHCSLCSCLCACHSVWENINSTQFSFPYVHFLWVCKHVCNSFSFDPYPILHTIC